LKTNGNRAKTPDYTRLLPRALRAIHYANVRSGILPSQSGFRRHDEHGAAQDVSAQRTPQRADRRSQQDDMKDAG
jgi:hypothetical protein